MTGWIEVVEAQSGTVLAALAVADGMVSPERRSSPRSARVLNTTTVTKKSVFEFPGAIVSGVETEVVVESEFLEVLSYAYTLYYVECSGILDDLSGNIATMGCVSIAATYRRTTPIVHYYVVYKNHISTSGNASAVSATATPATAFVYVRGCTKTYTTKPVSAIFGMITTGNEDIILSFKRSYGPLIMAVSDGSTTLDDTPLFRPEFPRESAFAQEVA